MADALKIVSEAAAAIREAYEEAKRAYQFAPSSYSHSVFRSVARAYQLAATARNMLADPPTAEECEHLPAKVGDRAAHLRKAESGKRRAPGPPKQSGQPKSGQR